jgi:hypothetical protein
MMPTTLALRCAVALVAAATPGCRGYVLQAAVDTVAFEITPPHQGLVTKLETSSNPTGQGILVFVRASDCIPKYVWLWLNGRIAYAVDATSQRLTPRLQTLNDAPPDIWRRIGSDPTRYPAEVRAAVCGNSR